MKFFIVLLVASFMVAKGTSQVCTKSHEVYRGCGNGCVTNCGNYKKPPICNMMCSTKYAGCYCESPYVRNADNDCVLTSECDKQSCTHSHEKYLSCSNGCQTTCENHENPPMCTQDCKTENAGCYCEAPYVRKSDGSCVSTSEC